MVEQIHCRNRKYSHSHLSGANQKALQVTGRILYQKYLFKQNVEKTGFLQMSGSLCEYHEEPTKH